MSIMSSSLDGGKTSRPTVELTERPMIEHKIIVRTSAYPTSGAVSPTPILLPKETSHLLKVCCWYS